ncbi:MAG: hypothetical protein VR70_12265 [Rhodospirillaceae bacterium BRH_c57]|nr:MAG: hypothetical protein VR70_12265 [Rhodospirillaceae bacterium BRH_c57]
MGRQHVVRRLTPYECLSLQGFAPDYCMVPVSRCRTGMLTSEEAADLIPFHAAEGRHYTKEELESCKRRLWTTAASA